MITVTCDECSAPIDRDEGRWFGVDYSEPIAAHPDPVQAMNDTETEMVAALKVGFAGDHEHHFCSAACLSFWALSHEGDTE